MRCKTSMIFAGGLSYAWAVSAIANGLGPGLHALLANAPWLKIPCLQAEEAHAAGKNTSDNFKGQLEKDSSARPRRTLRQLWTVAGVSQRPSRAYSGRRPQDDADEACEVNSPDEKLQNSDRAMSESRRCSRLVLQSCRHGRSTGSYRPSSSRRTWRRSECEKKFFGPCTGKYAASIAHQGYRMSP